MFNHEVKTHLPWASAPMVLYHHQQAHVSDQQAARFAGTFSIRSILSETRSHPEMSSKYQDHRYLGGVPATYSQPQVVCCNEDTNIHLENHTRNSMPSHTDGTLDTFETTKLQGNNTSVLSLIKNEASLEKKKTRSFIPIFKSCQNALILVSWFLSMLSTFCH